MNLKPFTPEKLRRRTLGQLWQLGLQFVLGMILNIVGSDTRGASHMLFVVVLLLHVLNGIGLVEGNLYIALKEKTNISWWAFAAVTTSLGAGVLTEAMPTITDVWSFVMAVGVVPAVWLNGTIYLWADRRLRA